MERISNDQIKGWCLTIPHRCLLRGFAGWLFAFHFVVCCVGPVWAENPAFPESQRVFPDTTVAWISIADPEDFGASFDRTQYGKLLSDPSMEAFVTSFRQQLSKAGKQRLGKLGLTIEDLGEIPGGEIAVAAIVPEAGRLATVLLVDTSGHEKETEELLGTIEDRLLEQKAERLADFEEKIRVYKLPQEDPSADDVGTEEPAEQVVAVVHEGRALVVGDDPVQVSHVLAVLENGRQDSLASKEQFAKVSEGSLENLADSPSKLRWYIDPFKFAAAYKLAHPPKKRQKGPDYVEILGRQGFDAVKALGGVIMFDDGPHQMRHQTIAYAPPLPGRDPASIDRYDLAARMLRFPESAEIQPLSWVPKNVSSWSSLKWDIQTAFQSAESLVDDVVGEKGVFDDVIASLKEDPDGPQIDVESDLIACLGKRIVLLGDYEEPIDIDSDRLVIAVEATDPEKVAATVGKSMATDPDMRRIEAHGVVIWELIDRSMEIPTLEIETPGGIVAHADQEEDSPSDRRRRLREKEEKLLPHSAVTVAHGHLLIASHRDVLERVLTMSEGDSLATSGDYKRIDAALKKLFPSPVVLWGFGRSDDSIRPTFEMLKRGAMPKSKSITGQLLNSLLGDGEPGSVRDQKIDGSTLPDFERIKKYFGTNGFVMQNLEDGWRLSGITLARSCLLYTSP
ncbi:MAG: hypothetical protein MPJ25_08610, partial [Pirellulales bacterium]|nr:hypothetical protein [Pirellulales bacterium]